MDILIIVPFIAGILIGGVNLLVKYITKEPSLINIYTLLLAIVGGLSTILVLYSYKTLELWKAATIITGVSIAATVILSVLFLHESISIQKWFLIFLVLGLLTVISLIK